jgi:phospholipid/cholesterol/gamma-HCH transport system substrate-binding protein
LNAKTNYSLVGAFVIISVGLITYFVIWMLQPSKDLETDTFRIEFSESVSGLNVGSPVKFRGVTIGKVRTIRISPTNIEKIEVIISVWKSTPIKTDTVAKLKSQGITGLSYIDLSRGSDAAPLLRAKNKNEIPLIPSEPSFFVTLERTFGSASENMSELLVRLKTLLGRENQDEVSRLLKHSANVAEKIDHGLTPERFAHFDDTIVRIGKLAKDIDAELPAFNRVLTSGDAMAKQAKVSLASLQRSFATMAETLRVINIRNKNGDYSVKETMGPGMAQFQMTMNQLEQTLILMNQMLRRYNQDPSGLLFEYQPEEPGPGEKQ